MAKIVRTKSGLDLFHPLILKWFSERVGTPTDIQDQAWPEIAKGNHVLVTAPTGSGKTLTAFLWAINKFLSGVQPPESQRVLYISPLKALNNDIQRNLQTPLKELEDYFAMEGKPFPDIRVAVRSGDTSPSERRHMLRHPPEIFITTPESLNILLTSKSGRRVLTGISTVILDEIHAVASSKRGAYLMTAIERLAPLNGEFQRIALSATVKPLERIAEFIGGYKLKESGDTVHYEKRPVSIIRSRIKKEYDISVQFPDGAGETDNTEVWWPALTESYRRIIDENHSTLFFANSRRMVEKVTRFINDTEGDRVYSHHGSLAKEIRSVVEKRFKEGELSAIISTSSLELGIDIGSVDHVVLIQAPFAISSAIQRIGRSGHGVGQVSRGTFSPIHSRDFVEAAVLAANIDGHDIETIKPVESPLDVLAQVILSMTVAEARDIDRIFHEIKASYPYYKLSRKEFDLVIEMLAGRYADARIRELKPRLLVDRVKNTAKARDSAPMLIYQSGGVIPDRGYFNLRVADTKAKIGELDEEFVWERSLGDAFPLGNQVWRIQRITHNDVEVQQVNKTNTLIPFWRAEEMNRSYHLSQKIGHFLKAAEDGPDLPEFKEKLLKEHHMTTRAAGELIDYLKRQKQETNAPLPHRHHILVEHFRDPVNLTDSKQTVLHTLWGGRVNRPFAFALASAWQEKFDYPLEVYVNNDCILLNLPHTFTGTDILDMVKPGKIQSLLRKKLEATGYFGARFRENAQRALLLPRQNFHTRMPLWLNRLRSKKLLEAVSKTNDFPIILETWRNCLHHEFELDALQTLLEEVQTGEIEITEVVTRKPSPFADGIIWRQTNQLMYEDDSPHANLRTNLSESLLKEVMYASHIRPRFSEQLLTSFRDKLHRVAPGYAPDSPEELLQWVRERLYLPAAEWQELLDAIDRDHTGEQSSSDILNPIGDRLFFLADGKADSQLIAVIAMEHLPRLNRALGIAAKEAKEVSARIKQKEILPGDESKAEALVNLLGEWLRFYGPVPRRFIQAAFRLDENLLSAALQSLLDEDRILIDEFREQEESGQEEICDTENLEILLRMRRSQARPEIEPKEIEALPLFIATYQGLTTPGDHLEDLQDSLEHLFGYPARAGLWESDIFPARLSPYYGSWLDTALRDNELVWFGSGTERVSFCFQSDIELFRVDQGKESEEKEDEFQYREAALKLREILTESGAKYGLADLAKSSKLTSMELTSSLWQLTWQGRVSNDHFKTLRNGIMNKFKPMQPSPAERSRRGGRGRFNFNRWQNSRSFTGNWFALPGSTGDDSEDMDPLDPLDRQEIVKDRIRQLFLRYGILFREILWNELPALRWSRVFPVLRLMELSGEIVSGHFFKGIPGLQFCTPAALGLFNKGLPEDAIYWMNAADPASPCGIGLEQLKPLFPHRLTTTHLVFHGQDLVLVSRKNGKELYFNIEPGHPRLPGYLEFFNTLLGREFQPIKYIGVEIINDLPALESPYKQPLQTFGFKKDYKALTLMKRY